MMNPNTKSGGSDLSRTLSHFSKCIGGLGAFYAAPQIARLFRVDAYHYLAGEFGHQAAQWGSWGFVAVGVLSVFFGITMLGLLLLNALIWLREHKGVM